MEPGAVVGGRFEIEARAGAGAMGTVYRARDRATDAALIRVDETTRDLLQARFEFTTTGAQVWLRRARPADDSTRAVLGRSVPFVGREREMRVLDAVHDAAVAGPAAQIALVIGAAGLGKSRLVRAWVRSRRSLGESFGLWIGRGDPMTTGSPYAMLLHALRHHADIERDDPATRRQQKLLGYAAARLGPADARRVAVFLGELVGAGFDDREDLPLRAARKDPRLMSDQLQQAWKDLLAAECAVRPLVLVLEDIHWADAPSIALVDAFARDPGERPLTIVAGARPEVAARFPELWAGRGATRLELRPLSARASEALMSAIVGDTVDAARAAALVDKAAGNPFFLEELGRRALEGEETTPESVLLTVQARFSALSPESRRVLRAAAILGEVTGEAVAALVAPHDAGRVAGLLDQLADRDWLCRRAAGDYVFRHELVREAAHALLTDEDRRRGHLGAARWLEGRDEIDPLVVAEHYEQAGESDRARPCFLRAAERAFAAGDLSAALECAGRGIALGADGVELGRLRLVQAEAHNWRGEHREAEACARVAFELIPIHESAWGSAANHLQWGCGARQAFEEVKTVAAAALEVPDGAWTSSHLEAVAWAASSMTDVGMVVDAERFLQRARSRGEAATVGLGALHTALSCLAYEQDDHEAAIHHNRASMEAYRAIGARRLAQLVSVNLAGHLVELGDFDSACSFLDGVRDAGPSDTLFLGVASVLRGWVHALRGSPDDGLRLAEGGLVLCGHFRGGARMRLLTASILCRTGQHERAIAISAETTELAGPRLAPVAQASEARCLLCLGRDRAAASRISAAVEEAGAARVRYGDVFVALVHVEALARAGRRPEAEVALTRARDLVLGRAGRMNDPQLRACFLANVPENARVLALAEAWLGPATRPA